MAYRALRPIGILAAVALLLVAAGCGSSNTGPTLKVTPVKGNVTMGGKALADAQVSLMFQGQPPVGFPGAGGKTDAQGNFEILTGIQKGVPAGTYTVVVNRLVGADGKPLVNDPNNATADAGMAMAEGKTNDSVPAPYNSLETSPEKVTVTDGKPITDLKVTIP